MKPCKTVRFNEELTGNVSNKVVTKNEDRVVIMRGTEAC